jgi:hypothetical protein
MPNNVYSWATGFQAPAGLAISGTDLYVANYNGNTISKVDLNNPNLNNVWATGFNGPSYLAISGTDLYVANYNGNTISKVDLNNPNNNSVWATGFQQPEGLAIFGTGLYVANLNTSRISKVDLNNANSNVVWATGFQAPNNLAISGTGLYVANQLGNTISKVDLNNANTNSVWATGFQQPVGLAISGTGLYVSNFIGKTIGNTISKVDLNNPNNNSKWATGFKGPAGLAISGTGLYVANLFDNVISRFEIYLDPDPQPVPNSGICFPAKTPIATDQGIITIDNLIPEIHTIRNKPIVAITKTIARDKYLICFEKDALAKNIPSQETIMSQCHLVFFNGKMIPANDFLYKNDNVKRIKYNGEMLYNVLLETHDKMVVNNLICETLHPENGVAKLYRDLKHMTREEQNKVIEAFNEYVIKHDLFVSKKKTSSNPHAIM